MPWANHQNPTRVILIVTISPIPNRLSIWYQHCKSCWLFTRRQSYLWRGLWCIRPGQKPVISYSLTWLQRYELHTQSIVHAMAWTIISQESPARNRLAHVLSWMTKPSSTKICPLERGKLKTVQPSAKTVIFTLYQPDNRSRQLPLPTVEESWRTAQIPTD